VEAPDAAGHEDRRGGEAEFEHQAAQLGDARQRRLGLFRVLAVRQAVMATGEPWILVDDAAEPIAELVIGPLPQGAEGTRRRHDRVVVDAVLRADLGNSVRHAGAAGDTVDEAARALEDAVQDALGRRHLPQHVHVDAPGAVGALMRDARLMNAAGDRPGDELLVPLAPRASAIDLFHRLALRVAAVRIHAGESANAAGCRPSTGTLAVGHRDAFAAFHQR